MERAATTAFSLEAEHDSGSGPRCQDTILGDAEAQTRFEAASTQFNDPSLLRVNTLGCGEGYSKEVRTLRYLSLVVPLIKVGDEAVHKEWGDKMERAATTAFSLEAEHDSGSGPRCQDTILGDAEAQTRFEAASTQFNDPSLLRVNTLGCGEGNIKLKELMEICTKLSE
nr:hypothetical protein [Tanacetum cinerariifolium]